MKLATLAAALLLPLALNLAQAQSQPLLEIIDPAGDDNGDGALIYPRDSAFAPGDLDLRSLRVFADGADLRFEATFRNPVRDPASAHSDSLGSEDLAQFARRGFYAFNLDIYIDTDRIPGSGNTITLPGRRARIDPVSAWEKAVVLTPRPELMRRQLRDALGSGPEVDAALDASVFFATQVRVRGRTVSFSVPRSFFGGANVGDATVTALVTLAELSAKSDLVASLGGGNAFDRMTLGVQQPQAGRPALAMGYSGDRAPATAVVDLLATEPQAQAQQLAAGATLLGTGRANRPTVPTVSPAPPAVAGALPWFTRALAAAQAAAAPAVIPAPMPVAAAPVPVPVAVPAPTPVPMPAPVPVPAPKAAAAAATAPPAAPPAVAAPAQPRGAASFEEQEQRLRTLKRLRDAGLISEDEYQAKRREILATL